MNAKMRGFVNGILLGVVGKPFPITQGEKEPVAYLYNGVQLPPLPEWDKETYPYAAMFRNMDTYGVYCFSKQPFTYSVNRYGVITIYHGTTSDTPAPYLSVEYDDGHWVTNSKTGASNRSLSLYIWANYDILNEDGSVYLKASEPIPVYE